MTNARLRDENRMDIGHEFKEKVKGEPGERGENEKRNAKLRGGMRNKR